ncbi:DNA polymerase III subunit delta [Sphingomonas panacisoli]|uniref:DNA-directed DNA polymerase n=1 Tax=Sphingomonas panacisoli TaxID=1813879 RepID=A0A5B8LL95_9SPHN|nr:DNA polymerase III subunit delta [Sphingomonas panacisoli]QDZ08843.1 DNA polymerase III subunit delta [Sphingomonas panacisoli]
MKASENQLVNAIDAASPAIRLYLLHGPDESGAADYAARLGRALGADAEKIAIEGSSLKSDPGRVVDEARSLALFGGRRWILINNAGEDAIEAAKMLIAEPHVEHPVVLIGPGLRSKGKLVEFAIAQPAAMSFACYVPDGANAERLVVGIAREHGLRPTPAAARRLMSAANGDRAVIAREIEKLALYLDAAADRPRELDDDVIDLLGAELGDAQMSDVVDAALEGRVRDISRELGRFADSGGSAIPLLRQIVRKLMSLAAMRGEVDAGADATATVKKRRLHFREEAGTIRLVQRWRAAEITAAIDRLRRAERALMSAGGAGEILSDVAITETTRAAARAR